METIPSETNAEPSRLSFREASAWLSLGGLLVVYIPYFLYVRWLFDNAPYRGGRHTRDVVNAFVFAVVVQIVLMTITHIALTLRHRPEPKDERDAAIELRSYRYGYAMLALTIMGSLLYVSLAAVGAAPDRGGHITEFPFFTQVILLCFVLSESLKYGVRGLGYQRGA